MVKLADCVKHPSVVVITGARGSGKSVTGHYLAGELKKKTKRDVYILCPRKMKKKLEEAGLKPVSYKYPGFKNKRNCIYIIDDAQLQLHARRFMSKININFDKFLSMSRHNRITFIIITQYSSRIDRNVLTAGSVLVAKRPSVLAHKLERSELRSMYRTISESFDSLDAKGKDVREYAYVVSDMYVGMVDGVKPPKYWDEDLSEW